MLLLQPAPKQTLDEGLAAWGLALDPADAVEEQEEEFALWPQHLPAVRVMTRMRTQWHLGAVGPIGLRYEAFPLVREALGVKPEDWPELFDEIQIMEDAQLDHWAEISSKH